MIPFSSVIGTASYQIIPNIKYYQNHLLPPDDRQFAKEVNAVFPLYIMNCFSTLDFKSSEKKTKPWKGLSSTTRVFKILAVHLHSRWERHFPLVLFFNNGPLSCWLKVLWAGGTKAQVINWLLTRTGGAFGAILWLQPLSEGNGCYQVMNGLMLKHNNAQTQPHT